MVWTKKIDMSYLYRRVKLWNRLPTSVFSPYYIVTWTYKHKVKKYLSRPAWQRLLTMYCRPLGGCRCFWIELCLSSGKAVTLSWDDNKTSISYLYSTYIGFLHFLLVYIYALLYCSMCISMILINVLLVTQLSSFLLYIYQINIILHNLYVRRIFSFLNT